MRVFPLNAYPKESITHSNSESRVAVLTCRKGVATEVSRSKIFHRSSEIIIQRIDAETALSLRAVSSLVLSAFILVSCSGRSGSLLLAGVFLKFDL